MSKPTIVSANGTVHMTWAEEAVQIDVSRLREHKDGRAIGEVKITTTAPGVPPLLHQAQLNLTSTRSRKELVDFLARRFATISWSDIVEQLSYCVLENLRHGEPLVEVFSRSDYKRPEYLLKPFLIKGQPTILFGPGGTSKSTLALIFGACVQLPWHDNPLRLETPTEPTNVGILDWETDEEDIGWHLSCLDRGMDPPPLSIFYRRCAISLADDMEEISAAVREHELGLVIVDSLAAATGGDIKEPEPVIRLFAALRQLKVTSLLITHRPKPQGKEDGGESTPFGSAYFWNFARSVWEVKKSQEIGEDSIEVGLFHRKANLSRLFPPVGFRLTFGEDTIGVERQDLTDVPDLAAYLPTGTKILNFLKAQNGRRQVAAIVAAIGGKPDTVARQLRRMQNKQIVKLYDDGWGLLYNGHA